MAEEETKAAEEAEGAENQREDDHKDEQNDADKAQENQMDEEEELEMDEVQMRKRAKDTKTIVEKWVCTYEELLLHPYFFFNLVKLPFNLMACSFNINNFVFLPCSSNNKFLNIFCLAQKLP